MSMTKIYRSANGQLINIGEWDYQVDPTNPEGEKVQNPLPEGAYEDQADVVVGWDGGLYLAGDPRARLDETQRLES